MKKILVLFFAAIMCCSVAQAQFHIGAKAGANFSNYVGDNAPHKMNVNYHVGGFVEFGVLGILSVAPSDVFCSRRHRKSAGIAWWRCCVQKCQNQMEYELCEHSSDAEIESAWQVLA